jgi:hypothetical protein
MNITRAAIAAAVLIIPVSAFAAANEPVAAPEKPAAEQIQSAAETDRIVAQDAKRESGRESEALARAPVTPPVAPSKPKAVRKFSSMRAASAPQPSWGCSGYWCGRQFVLMLGVGY